MEPRAYNSGTSESPPPVPASPSIGYPTSGDPASAQPATVSGPYRDYAIGEEIRNVILAAGLTPDIADLTQLLQAINLFASPVASDGHAPWFKVDNTSQAAQNIPSDVVTKCTNMVVTDGNMGSAFWSGSAFTVDASTQGLWFFLVRLNTNSETGEGQHLYLNGSLYASALMSADSGNGNVTSITIPIVLNAGDVVEFYHRHLTGSTVTNTSSYVIATHLRGKI